MFLHGWHKAEILFGFTYIYGNFPSWTQECTCFGELSYQLEGTAILMIGRRWHQSKAKGMIWKGLKKGYVTIIMVMGNLWSKRFPRS